MERKSYQRNEIIFEQDDYAATMYELVSGSVGVFVAYGSPEERHLATFGPGDFFGEMGLVECYPRSATAVVLSDVAMVDEIDASDFAGFYQDQPDKVLAIMRQLSARLRETNEKYVEARQAVYEAVEAERAGRKRSRSLGSRLGEMVRFFRRSAEAR